MHKPEITRLYHYQSIELEARHIDDFKRKAVDIGDNIFLDKNKLDSLLDRHAYFSTPMSYNDPFEGDFTLSLEDLDPKELMSIIQFALESKDVSTPSILQSVPQDFLYTQLESVIKQNPQHFAQLIIDTLRLSVGFYCLTEEPEDVLMWAHYAANHSGIALEFERTPDSTCGTMTFEVDYFDVPPVISLSDIIIDFNQANNSKTLEEKARYLSDSSLRKLLYSKTKTWGHENEWRTSHKPGRHDMPGKLVSIIFGYDVKPKVIDYLKSCKELDGVSFKYIKPDKSTYKLKMYDEDDIELQVQRIMESISVGKMDAAQALLK
ncbi:DUF2971 domain-containing protein [Shewanella woodyi]|uniref:DUF2971 domain-containing protein n=1 Tax=Shewanella woodyi TaxID=60961 RepID=UPI0007F8C4B1|nr:DUF2971 domain-containing protein [Shewanella woodyi]